MGSFSFAHWLIVIAVVLIVFGAGRLPGAMSDLAKGIRSFKAGMRDDDAQPAGPALNPSTPGPRSPRQG
jgi:sec-independent protein translocase protein TatA